MEVFECRMAADEQGGQDMRNLWHQTYLWGEKNKKAKTYAVCLVCPEACYVTIIGCSTLYICIYPNALMFSEHYVTLHGEFDRLMHLLISYNHLLPMLATVVGNSYRFGCGHLGCRLQEA